MLVAVTDIILAVSLTSVMASGEEFYVRYYVGHKGKFGHEFLEFEFRPDGEKKLRSLCAVCVNKNRAPLL